MSTKQYSFIFLLGSLLTTTAWYVVVTNIDPVSTGAWAFVLFYFTLAIALSGWLVTALTIFRAFFRPKQSLENSLINSLRQGILLGLAIIGALLLQNAGYFSMWAMLGLVAIILLVEFFAFRADEDQSQ